MAPVPGFCGGSYTLQSSYIDSELAINLYCERPESEAAKSQITLLLRPGKKLTYMFAGENSMPCEFEVNGRGFAAGANLWEVFQDGSSINRGTLNGPPLQTPQICVNQTHLLILSNGDLFVFVLTPVTDSNGVLHPANEFLAVDMAQFNGPVLQIDFIDGYFIATLQSSNTFQVSNLEDGTTWNGLFISTIGYFPDNIVSFKVDHREIQFMSGKKSVWYYNCGAGFPPFIPIQGAYMEEGAGATSATVQANNTVAWIAQDERGSATAKIVTGGYVGQRISTFAVETAWQRFSRIDDAVGYSYQEEGHIFWQIRFPSADKTWVYDFATQLWHERAFWENGRYSADRSASHMFVFGKHLVGDPKSGAIYESSVQFMDDFGNPIRWNRRVPDKTVENKWIEFPRFEVDVEVGLQASKNQSEVLTITAVQIVFVHLGLGIAHITIKDDPSIPFKVGQQFLIQLLKIATELNGQTLTIDSFSAVAGGWIITGTTSLGAQSLVNDTGTATLTNGPQFTVPVQLLDGNGQPRAAQCILKWSNDATKTWSNEYVLNCGKVGEYGGRVYKSMTGRGRRRVWDLSGTDPIAWKITGAYRDAICEGREV